ncbi:MAG: bifunctional oligoribonuclease/PAP phosphatase NrnA [Candidatus Omnitrophica bacterium]|nr:bifunctional oligoribonuclease/PAP phosphatase NrnA [Candidatus Omnitrophota bacterium]
MKKRINHSLNDFCKALKRHDRFLLSCHVAPEGDAIGSMLAMASLLKRLGKKITLVCDDVFPARLPCLSSKGWNQPHQIKKSAKTFEALLTTDCPNLGRTGHVSRLISQDTVIFNIDHHISNNYFGHYNYVCPDRGATGEVVYDIYEHLKMPLTREDAKNLYVAISTDTGSFKYSTTTVHSHRVAEKLISTGIDIEKINEQIYATYSLNKMQLYSRLLGRVKTSFGGRVAWGEMRQSDLKKSGATYEDTEGFIDFLRYMKEVKIVFFMSEMNPHQVKVSFRCKEHYDVNKIATHFGGGGHRKASGCIIDKPLKIAEKMILAYIQKERHFK